MPRLKCCQANALAASALRKSNFHGLTFQQNTRVQYLYGDMGVSEKRRVPCIRVDNDLQSTTHTVLNARKQGDNCAAIHPKLFRVPFRKICDLACFTVTR